MSAACPLYTQHRTFPDAVGTSQLGGLDVAAEAILWVLTLDDRHDTLNEPRRSQNPNGIGSNVAKPWQRQGEQSVK